MQGGYFFNLIKDVPTALSFLEKHTHEKTLLLVKLKESEKMEIDEKEVLADSSYLNEELTQSKGHETHAESEILAEPTRTKN